MMLLRVLLCCGLIGASLFTLAAGEAYRLGAQDKIAVTVLKHTELSQTYTVPPDGVIDFPRLGRLLVSGKTTAEVAEALRAGYADFLRAPEVSVVVADAHKKSAYVLGAVARPGQYPLEEGARITELLSAAGDVVGERGKLTAELVRGGTKLPVDLQAALGGDKPAANLSLQEGDVLWVQAPQQITVMLAGQVKSPGMIKLLKGSTLLDALALAGDVTGEREKLSATLSRDTHTIPVNLQAVWAGDHEANLPLADGDMLMVQEPAKINVVVSGRVHNPGLVKVETGSTLSGVLAAVGDLLDRPERVKISLIRGATTDTLTWGDKTTVMQNGDVISVEPEQVVRVYVSGHVRNPGAYELLKDGGVLEAIAMAGGVIENAALGQIAIVNSAGTTKTVNLLPALTEGKVTANPKLENGDHVLVPESTTKISVLGMVAHPGNYPVSDSHPLTVVDAISVAGGEAKRAQVSKTVVIRVVNNKPQRIPVDVDSVLKKGKYQANVQLQPNDIVYVPETTTPDWGQVFDNLYRIGFLATL